MRRPCSARQRRFASATARRAARVGFEEAEHDERAMAAGFLAVDPPSGRETWARQSARSPRDVTHAAALRVAAHPSATTYPLHLNSAHSAGGAGARPHRFLVAARRVRVASGPPSRTRTATTSSRPAHMSSR